MGPVAILIYVACFIFWSDAVAQAVAQYVALLIYVACFIFWLWMLIDLLTSSASPGTKILWVILMLFLPVLGSILYFFLARKKI